jgi:hypothetical protein
MSLSFKFVKGSLAAMRAYFDGAQSLMSLVFIPKRTWGIDAGFWVAVDIESSAVCVGAACIRCTL